MVVHFVLSNLDVDPETCTARRWYGDYGRSDGPNFNFDLSSQKQSMCMTFHLVR